MTEDINRPDLEAKPSARVDLASIADSVNKQVISAHLVYGEAGKALFTAPTKIVRAARTVPGGLWKEITSLSFKDK